MKTCQHPNCDKSCYRPIGSDKVSDYCAPHWWRREAIKDNNLRRTQPIEVIEINDTPKLEGEVIGKCQICGGDIIGIVKPRGIPRKFCHNEFCIRAGNREKQAEWRAKNRHEQQKIS